MQGVHTIGITISRGGTARNILQTRCFEQLKARGCRLVIITQAWNDPEFVATFAAPNVFFEPLLELPWRARDNFLVSLHKTLVYNTSTASRDLYGLFNPENEANAFKYYVRRFLIQPFTYIQSLHRAARVLDQWIAPARDYHQLFTKYQFDLIFSTSVIEDVDVELMKTAQEYHVPIIGMAKTWDTLSKINMRIAPEKLIVWGEYSRIEAMKYSAYSEKDILVCGIPQFDFYHDDQIKLTREDFCQVMGLDPTKKIIVFGSEGKVTPHDPEIAHMIADAIADGTIRHAQLLVRPHFMYTGDSERFESLKNKPGVVVDTVYNSSPVFRDRWDYSRTQITRFSNVIMHADLMVTSPSTLSIDAASVDCPVINYYFDGTEEKDFKHSIKRWYSTEHYQNVLATNAISLVENKDQLINTITILLDDPSIKRTERKQLTEYFGLPPDNQSGVRIAEAVLSMLT